MGEDQLRQSDPYVTRSDVEGVAVLSLARPPENFLDAPMRAALIDALEAVVSDDDVCAIVIAGLGRSFSRGRPLHALNETEPGPTVTDLCAAVANTSKPVVAALTGAVFEGGAGVALACDLRVAAPSTRLFVPDVTYGLVPDGGTVARVVMLGGVAAARAVLVEAKALDGPAARGLGIVDEVTDGSPLARAIDLAREIAQGRREAPQKDTPRISDMAAELRAAAALTHETRGQGLLAPKKIAGAVEAALLLPFEGAVLAGEAARQDAHAAPQSQALLHIHTAEARATRPQGYSIDGVQKIATVGIAGTGNIALGLTIAALDRGVEVRLMSPSHEVAQRDVARLGEVYRAAVRDGRIDDDGARACMGRLEASGHAAVLDRAPLVIEATMGSARQRADAAVALEAQLASAVPLATVADSGFDAMAARMVHPERFCAAHVFAPAQVSKLVELARLARTTDATMATVHVAMKALGKSTVDMVAQDGLVANPVQGAGFDAVDVLLLIGARPKEIDDAMRAFGRPVGPCKMMDALGLIHMRGAVARMLVEQGRKGRKRGGGFFDDDGDDAAAMALISGMREAHGLPEATVPRAEIIGRIVMAEANAGARLLDAGVVAHPRDIDVVMVAAKGFPRTEGGPMQWADRLTPLQAEKALRQYAKIAPEIWEPAAIWHRLVRDGLRFENLN